jgi:hypothetical protein
MTLLVEYMGHYYKTPHMSHHLEHGIKDNIDLDDYSYCTYSKDVLAQLVFPI